MLLDSNAVIHTGTASNGNIALKSNAKLCGPSTGRGRESNHQRCERPVQRRRPLHHRGQQLRPERAKLFRRSTRATRPRTTTTAASSSKTPLPERKNRRLLCGRTPAGKASALCKGRELFIDGSTSVTLGGSIYSFCKLTMRSNSNLFVAPNAKVTIYFDSPEACGYADGVTQLDMSSNTRITSSTGNPVSVAMLFVGSEKTRYERPAQQQYIRERPL
jgi:hypothetical protein